MDLPKAEPMPRKRKMVTRFDWRGITHPDRLAILFAGIGATIVMAFGFWRGVNAFEVIWRTSVTSGVLWLATFFGVLILKLYVIRDGYGVKPASQDQDIQEQEETPVVDSDETIEQEAGEQE